MVRVAGRGPLQACDAAQSTAGVARHEGRPNTDCVDVRSRILEALLTSAVKARPRRALDLTRQGFAAQTLVSLGVDCRRIPIAQEMYGLIVCTMDSLRRMRPLVAAEGSLVVHTKPGQHGELLGLAGEFELVASARTPAGAWLQLRRVAGRSAVAPRVSLVVTTRNEAGVLAQLLTSLEDQPTDPAWELVLVDRGSTDATTDLLERVTGDVRRIRVPRDTNPIDAIFAGLRVAQGDLLLPMPAGLAPGCGFVSALLRHEGRHQITDAPLVGTIVAPDTRTLCGSIRAMGRTAAPNTPRRLARWFERTDGVVVPGFRVRQLLRGPTPSVCDAPESLDRGAQPKPNAVLA